MLNELLENPDFAASAPGLALRSKPLGFIDVGARGGVHKVVDRLAGATAVLAFEPDLDEYERLKCQMGSGSVWATYAVEPTALAAAEGEAQLHMLSSAVNCSLRPPNPAFVKRYAMAGFDLVKTLSLRTTSLDKVLWETRKHEDFWGEFIKIDTQGTEFEILQGAQRTLQERAVALLVEAEFFPMYRGEKLFSEVEQWLRTCGFSFYGFDLHCRSAKLLDKRKSAGRERTFFADAIFFKDPLSGGLWPNPLNQRSLFALFASALLLGYHDFALQLALETWATGGEATRIRRLVEHETSRLAAKAHEDVMALAERGRLNPDRANVEVGKFVDARRHLADYDDVKV
jgi:FkbM family methyltransferase